MERLFGVALDFDCLRFNIKLVSLAGMQRPEIDVSSEASSLVTRLITPDEGPSFETSKFSLYFQVVSCIPINEAC